jgi:predicted CoA-binding protein
MDHDAYADDYIGGILNEVKTVAVVGASSNPSRPSYYVMKYMKRKGYRCIPVNPGLAGQELLGEMAYASLSDIPDPIDMVDCFRSSDAIPPIVDVAIKIGAKVIWMQLGVRHDEAAKVAEATGLRVVMNRCPKIEFGRLSGEIAFMGGRSDVISSKRSKLVGKKTS